MTPKKKTIGGLRIKNIDSGLSETGNRTKLYYLEQKYCQIEPVEIRLNGINLETVF